MTQGKGKSTEVEQSPFSDAMMRKFADMAAILPRGAEDGGERILEAILNAQTLDATNEIWAGTWNPDKMVGEPIVVESAEVLSSDYKGGLGIFLLVRCVKVRTGEAGMFSTGSTSIVGQVVKAYVLGALPFTCKIVVADEPTSSGYLPQHLEILPPAQVLGS